MKRAAKAAGLGFDATLHHATFTVTVKPLYNCDAERLGLTGYVGSTTTWLRSVLTEDELLQVKVGVVVDNSDPMVDYFSTSFHRVAANWEHYVSLGDVSNTWANDFIYGDGSYELERYSRGELAYTAHEVEELAPSAHAARALAVAHLSYLHQSSLRLSGPARPGNWAELIADREATRGRIMALDSVALELLLGMLQGWELSAGELVDAVEILIPQEAISEPAAAPVAAGEMPQALQDYLGRLLHEPKRVLVLDIWGALQCGGELPVNIAPWAADVQAKALRYAKV